MIITFKGDMIRGFIGNHLNLYGFEELVKQEMQKIVDKHRKAATEEIQKLAFKIATLREVENMGVTLTIEVSEPKEQE